MVVALKPPGIALMKVLPAARPCRRVNWSSSAQIVGKISGREPGQPGRQPGHPQTQGKVERFQQTLKKWLAAQQPQPATLTQLQALLDTFTSYYNHQRPHRSLAHRATPATAYISRPKATPGSRRTATHDRVRTDRVDTDGKLTLRHAGKLHHIGTGRTHARTGVLMLIHDRDIRIINAATGELLHSPHPRP